MLRLQIERQKRGWSKARESRESGLNVTTIGLVESGRLRPYPGQLRKLAEALDWPEDRAEELLEDVSDNRDRRQARPTPRHNRKR